MGLIFGGIFTTVVFLFLSIWIQHISEKLSENKETQRKTSENEEDAVDLD